MKFHFAGIGLLCALIASPIHAQSTIDGAAYKSITSNAGVIPRGEARTWTWKAPKGAYVAYVRVNFRLLAEPSNGHGGYHKGDSRIMCRLYSDGGVAGYDQATGYIGSDQVTATGLFSSASQDGTFTLVAMIDKSYLDVPTKVILTCNNTTVSENGLAIPIDFIAVNLVPVSTVNSLEMVPGSGAAPPSASKSNQKEPSKLVKQPK